MEVYAFEPAPILNYQATLTPNAKIYTFVNNRDIVPCGSLKNFVQFLFLMKDVDACNFSHREKIQIILGNRKEIEMPKFSSAKGTDSVAYFLLIFRMVLWCLGVEVGAKSTPHSWRTYHNSICREMCIISNRARSARRHPTILIRLDHNVYGNTLLFQSLLFHQVPLEPFSIMDHLLKNIKANLLPLTADLPVAINHHINVRDSITESIKSESVNLSVFDHRNPAVLDEEDPPHVAI